MALTGIRIWRLGERTTGKGKGESESKDWPWRSQQSRAAVLNCVTLPPRDR